MNKKYELVKDDYIDCIGKTLYRIKALKDFGYVKAGELGGYIQSEKNLSHEGDCWIYGNAKVLDNAEVYENANVYGNVLIYGNAEVHGNAQVYDNAQIYMNAEIYENAEVFGDAQIYMNAKVYGNAEVYDNSTMFYNAEVYGNAQIHGDAEVFGSARIQEGNIIGIVSIPYKDIFQYQCKNRMLTAILTENDEILYSIGCQYQITEKKFLDRIHNKDGGLEENPHREEYLRLISLINIYFRGELKWTENMNY